MGCRPTKTAIAFLLVLCITAPSFPQNPASTKKTDASRSVNPSAGLSERQRVLHALNRLTFGPRPGEVNVVLGKGLDSWIEDQLHPESIDDSALNARLAPYATTRMSLKQIADLFPSDNVITQVVSGKRALPSDPAQKMTTPPSMIFLRPSRSPKVPPASMKAAKVRAYPFTTHCSEATPA